MRPFNRKKVVEKTDTTTLTRTVTVNRSLAPQHLLGLTGRKQYTDKSVVATMPSLGTGVERIQVEFFKLNRWISDNDLVKEYQQRGLIPDPYAQTQVNINDPAFADAHPNGTYWQDSDNKWCFVNFDWDENYTHDVCVDHNGAGGWATNWWFGGVRKSSQTG